MTAVRRKSSAEAALSSAELRTLFAASQRALVANRPISSLRLQRSLSAAELAALDEAGLSAKPWREPPSKDPLAQSIVSYMALIETSFTTAKVAEMLGVDVSRIRQRLRERSLFGFEHEGEWRLPRFQFEKGRILPGLPEVVRVLSEDLNPLDVAEWFMMPTSDLEEQKSGRFSSPREWLLRGRAIDPVVQLARHL